MRLLVDAQCIASSSSMRGVGRYALSLMRALVRTAGDHHVEVLLAGGAEAQRLLRARTALEQLLPERAVHVFDAAWPWEHPQALRLRPAAEAAAAAAAASLGADAMLVLSAFERDDETVLAMGVRSTGLPTATMLYDLIPALAPETYLMGPEASSYWRRYGQLATSDALLAISEHSASQARRAFGARCPPITPIWGGPYPHGAFPGFESDVDDLPGLVLPDRFVLSVGGDHPRKNLDRLLQAWARVPPRVRNGMPLVLACRLNPGTVRRLERAAQRSGLGRRDLVLTGRVSERTLQALYTRAHAFVFPSTEEGLGMPVLEAMHAGCPTLLARGSSLSELADEDAAFFDPLDIEDMAVAMTRALADAAALDSLRQLALRSTQTYTWERAATRAWRALEALPKPVRLSPRPPPLPVRLSDAAAVRALSAAPAPVLLDAPLPAGPLGVLGLPVAPRAALAPATALLAPNSAASSGAIRAGLLDHPVLLDPAQLADVAAHDFHAACADRLSHLNLDPTARTAVVVAARRSPRWTLHRPRPVWLLLADEPATDTILSEAERAGVDLVQAALSAVELARQADTALVPAAALTDLEEALLHARCRGTTVAVLHPQDPSAATPPWCIDVVLNEGTGAVAGWQGLLGPAAPAARTTGWPWRQRD
jgi:glycosyltransferase involved in cell wall biosynthesis